MLVDSSVWIDHLRRGNARLAAALLGDAVWCHDFVIGELATGSIADRTTTLNLLRSLPKATVATQDETMDLVNRCHLWGKGLGWIDAHLLAAARLSGLPLYTLDKRLAAACPAAGVYTV